MLRTDASVIAHARHLRLFDRKSLREISDMTGVSKSTLSVVLRDLQLTEEEARTFAVNNATRSHSARVTAAEREDKERHARFNQSSYDQLSTNQKGAISEGAVIQRLMTIGVLPFTPVCQGGRVDLLGFVPESRKFLRFQVKTARRQRLGSAVFQLRARTGGIHTCYGVDDFDILVAHSPTVDACYISRADEIHGRTSSTVRESDREAWDKVLNF